MSPSGATCFHSNVVLRICTPGLTPNPSPKGEGSTSGVGQIKAPLLLEKIRAAASLVEATYH
jgi:hypothetical protein